MGRIYDVVRAIDDTIARKKLPFYKTRGMIAIDAGLSLVCIDASTPDDATKIERLRAAAQKVLGERIS